MSKKNVYKKKFLDLSKSDMENDTKKTIGKRRFKSQQKMKIKEIKGKTNLQFQNLQKIQSELLILNINYENQLN